MIAIIVQILCLMVTIIVLINCLLMFKELDKDRAEREQLYNRLMAGNLNDYRQSIDEKPPPKGGNMVTAGLRKAANRQYEALSKSKAGDT